jgi:phosphopantothenoylcysteine decarboxylase/phosphopantothenate--cysteine ligase
VRLLVQQDIDVQVAMTEAACGFITPATLQALSGQPVYTDMWDARVANAMGHIELSRGKNAVVVAPATADFIAKLAHGLADDLLSTACLARECPLLIAPAMNRQMWDNPATRRNVTQLIRDGVVVLGPASGDQACGEVGMGRMLEAAQISEAVIVHLAPRHCRGCGLITADRRSSQSMRCAASPTGSGKMGCRSRARA